MAAGKDPKTGWSPKVDAKSGRHARFFVKDLVVDYTQNYARACLYTYKGKPCCFHADEPHVVELMQSLLRSGQQQPIKVYADGRGRPTVAAGFRRVFAFSVLADLKQVDQIPDSDGGRIMAIKGPAPKSPEDYLALADANLAENDRRAPSPVDVAHALRRFALGLDEYGEFALGKEEAGRRIAAITGHSLSVPQVSKYLQLLALPPSILGQVHRGELAMSTALRAASESGQGKARGPRPGLRKSEIVSLSDHLPPTFREYTRYLLGLEADEPEVVRRAREKMAAKEA